MLLVKKAKSLLTRPFPQEESWVDTLKIVSAISAFVFIFLYIFKPFGMHLAEGEGFLLLCLGFACVAFVSSIVYEFIALKVIRIKGGGMKFTFARWIVYFIGAILVISLANFIFVRMVLFDDIEWSLYPPMMKGTFAIGLFPAIFFGALALLRQERKYQSIAAEINQQTPSSKTSETNAKHAIFGIPVNEIRYVEAMQNYIKIGYLNADNTLQKHTERATLTGVIRDLSSDTILRCHRSFLVNRNAIISSEGNAQGLLLSLSDCDKKIPVSRSYVSAFKRR